jgi:hypothetical protein
MGILGRARAKLRESVPDWLNTDVKDIFRHLELALSEPEPPPPPLLPVERGTPHWRRVKAVYEALDQYLATVGRVATYPVLIQHVTETTGKGCSKRIISRWKKERGL